MVAYRLAVLVATMGLACSPAQYMYEDRDGGTSPDADGPIDGAPHDDADRPPLEPGCASGSEWIYAVGFRPEEYDPYAEVIARLLRYEPDSSTISPIGILRCPWARDAGRAPCPFSCCYMPFTMSVDRNGQAWVLLVYPIYTESGRPVQLLRCSTSDASCEPTDFVPGTDGFEIFSMGFGKDRPEDTEEQLFITGGPWHVYDEEEAFGVLDLSSFNTVTRGRLPLHRELVGTGNGILWGFVGIEGTFQRLDPETGEALGALFRTGLILGDRGGGYDFAHWGGDLYLFFSNDAMRHSQVYRLDPEAAEMDVTVDDVGIVVTGAGVSTCAPYELY
jgi:hypothetical protein